MQMEIEMKMERKKKYRVQSGEGPITTIRPFLYCPPQGRICPIETARSRIGWRGCVTICVEYEWREGGE